MTEPASSATAHDPYRTPSPPRACCAERALFHPYDGQTRMRLVLACGIASASLRVDPDARALITIDAGSGPAPRLRVRGSEVRLSWSRSPVDWLHALLAGGRDELEIALHPAVEWALEVQGGASSLRADLASGSVSGVEVDGGCSDVVLELPRPVGIVPIRVAGGASRLRVRRPADVAVAVAVRGGVSSLRIDGRCFDTIGGTARLDGLRGEHGYELDVFSGASDVEITASRRGETHGGET